MNTDKAEAHYDAVYIGQYDLPGREGPFWVFRANNPDFDAGHTRYFGLIVRWGGELRITGADEILEAKFPAMLCKDGAFLASRHRHDYVTNGEHMMDGGLSYTRASIHPIDYVMTIEGTEEVFTRA